MNRRHQSFLLAIVAVVARVLVLALFSAGSAGLADVQAAPVPTSARIVTPLLTGWRFHDGPQSIDAASPSFHDSDWQSVALPHSWNALGEYALNRTQRTHNRQGEGWYRLTIAGERLPNTARHFLQFDGVGNVADVWVNGRYVAHHAGAFSRFRVDVSGVLKRHGPNLVAVRANNAKPEPGSPTQDVIPLAGDFFIHGGLYRPVSLISVGRAHVDLLDHGGPGVYIRTVSLNDGSATVEVSTRVDRGNLPALELRTTIKDGTKTAGRSDNAASQELVRQLFVIARPHLWNGRSDPHLYEAVVELLDHGRVVDRVSQKFGIRTFRFDPDRGFFLNGRHVPLHGVSRHQDYLGRGWALTHADHARDMAMIEELGANTIRMAHYEHAQDWYDLADSAGMIVWAELPFVNKLSFGDVPATKALVANARDQLLELIRQNYNHPSIVTWSIGNETNIDIAGGRLGSKADPRPLLDQLHEVARTEDPGRPTAIADCCEDMPNAKIVNLPVLAGHSELMGYNRYYGWYYGKTSDLGPGLDALHAKHPGIPMSVSEYGAGAALSQHSDNPEGGPISAGGRPHPEEYQSWFHEQSWPQLAVRPYLFATWIWNMFDFSSTVRHEGDATDINDKGLVTFDRRVKKDAFYYYQAQWRDDVPVLHITGRRYVERAYPVVDVRIYSNLRTVSLFLNGMAVGTARCSGRICIVPAVHLRGGWNHLEARGVFGNRRVTDTVDWNAADPADGLTIKVGDLAGFRGVDGHRVGSDNWFVGGTPKSISAKSAASISGVGDARFRSAARIGAFRYAIPLPNGRWHVAMLFVNADQEVRACFSVNAEGRRVLEVCRLPRNVAVQQSFDVDVRDGELDLQLGPDATLSAIDIRRASYASRAGN